MSAAVTAAAAANRPASAHHLASSTIVEIRIKLHQFVNATYPVTEASRNAKGTLHFHPGSYCAVFPYLDRASWTGTRQLGAMCYCWVLSKQHQDLQQSAVTRLQVSLSVLDLSNSGIRFTQVWQPAASPLGDKCFGWRQ